MIKTALAMEREEATMFRVDSKFMPELLPLIQRVAARYAKKAAHYEDIRDGGEMTARQENLLIKYQELNEDWDILATQAERHVLLYCKDGKT